MADDTLKQAEDLEDEEIGELQIEEYIVLILAFSVYTEYVEDQTQAPADDQQTQKGVRLLRLLDAQQATQIHDFLLKRVTREESKLSLGRTFRVRVGNVAQATRRALTLRTVLNRGGVQTLKAVFESNRFRKAVRTAIVASMLEDPAAALGQFAAIQIRNLRIKGWIQQAKQIAGSPNIIQNPVENATGAAADGVKQLKKEQLVEDGSAAIEDVQQSQTAQQEILYGVQQDATVAAREAMEASGEEDLAPQTKSEVVGIATAAAAAVVSEMGNHENTPDALKRLDPEQRAAALTDGRVLVVAGAGSGKSTTLVSRVEYLIESKGVNPSKVLVSSFNKKAADELKIKIGKAVGGEVTSAMTVGTLHGLFLGAIKKYGSQEEKAMFQGGFSVLNGSAISTAVNRIWRKCYATETSNGTLKDANAPKAKQMRLQVTKWSGNGITVAEARATAQTKQQQQAALWYEMYEGLKGSIPGWKPSCDNRAEAKSEYDRYMKKNRTRRDDQGREYTVRIGDFDDMISVFLNLLERNPEVRERAQQAFDHVLIDECQDLNSQQHKVLKLLTEHIDRDAKDKSFWMVGDLSQAIYEFRGGRPDLFVGVAEDENTKVRKIQTNYRCAPEVVDLANRLIAHNDEKIEGIEANPSPTRPRGETSVQVSGYSDEAETALAVAEEVKKAWDEGAEISDNAVLCRTNNELNSYETAFLMKGLPYARKGASSFLSSPETKAFLGYITLVTDTDHEKMQKSLKDILNKPNRFFVAPEKVERAVDNAIGNYARKTGISKNQVNPMQAFQDSRFMSDLVSMIKDAPSGFKFNKGMDALRGLHDHLLELSALTQDETATTNDLFDAVLSVPGIAFDVDPHTGKIRGEKPVTFREELNANIKDYGSEEEDEAEDAETMSLGNISFLYELAKPDPNDPGDQEIPPNTPKGFWAKMGRLTEKASELRIDLDKWEKDQEKYPPEERKPAPGIYMGTSHSTKGAQWPQVYVQMPRGRFPMMPRTEDEESETTSRENELALKSERRLAYVALTRPSKNLRVVYPRQIQGKPAGPSQFISEAGLVEGENVLVDGMPVGGVPKSAFLEDIEPLRSGHGSQRFADAVEACLDNGTSYDDDWKAGGSL